MGKESRLCQRVGEQAEVQRELLYGTAFYPFEPVHTVSISSTPLKLEFTPLGMRPRPVRGGGMGLPAGDSLSWSQVPGPRGLSAPCGGHPWICSLLPLWGLHANQGRFSTWPPPCWILLGVGLWSPPGMLHCSHTSVSLSSSARTQACEHSRAHTYSQQDFVSYKVDSTVCVVVLSIHLSMLIV